MSYNTEKYDGGVKMEQTSFRIKELRKKHNLSQKQVAEYLGIPQKTYSNYERNTREIPAVYAVSLAKLYKVSVDSLLGINASARGIDLNAAFLKNVSLKTVLIHMVRLDHHRRQELIRFLSYLMHHNP